MFEALETGWGLDVILWLQSMRNEPLNLLVHFLDLMNDSTISILLFGIIYWMLNKRLGMRVFFAFILAAMATFTTKELLMSPRPYDISEAVSPLFYESTYGIPSGHVSMQFVLWGYLAWYSRKWWTAIPLVLYISLQAFGRMYAGVHYPQDVVAGAILGFVVLVVYAASVERVVAWWKAQNLALQLAPLLIFAGILALFLFDNKDSVSMLGILVGTSFAVTIETRWIHFIHMEAWSKRLIQFALGITLCLGILIGLDKAFEQIAPPTYEFDESRSAQIATLRSDLNLADADATTLCLAAEDAEDLDLRLLAACDAQLSPLEALLRSIRYGLVAFFALALYPYLSIRLGLLQIEGNLQPIPS